jgi:hypothetical protein
VCCGVRRISKTPMLAYPVPRKSGGAAPIRQRWVVSSSGLLATLFLHLFLVAPFLLSSTATRRATGYEARGAKDARSFEDAEETSIVSIFEDLPGTPKRLQPRVVALQPTDLERFGQPIRVELQPIQLFGSRGPEILEDVSQSAAIYGRYVSLVEARIGRAWQRPRSPIGADRFRCLVRIRRDNKGNVGDVTTESCNGTELWQSSLARAIRRASPLPVVPDGIKPMSELMLTFESTGNERPEQFEPEAAVAVTAKANGPNELALQMFNAQLRESPNSASAEKPITLTLTGTGPAVGIANGRRFGRPLPTRPGKPEADKLLE